MLLLLDREENEFVNFYLRLLTFVTQVEKYKDFQICFVNKNQQEKLNRKVLPCFLDEKGNERISLIEITRFVAEICGQEDSLLGITEKDVQGVLKVFEIPKALEFSFEKVMQAMEMSLTGNMFIDQSINMKVSDLFIFCFLYRKLVISEDEIKQSFPNVC